MLFQASVDSWRGYASSAKNYTCATTAFVSPFSTFLFSFLPQILVSCTSLHPFSISLLALGYLESPQVRIHGYLWYKYIRVPCWEKICGKKKEHLVGLGLVVQWCCWCILYTVPIQFAFLIFKSSYACCSALDSSHLMLTSYDIIASLITRPWEHYVMLRYLIFHVILLPHIVRPLAHKLHITSHTSY